ncbi:hypothetical protein F5X68DRAFT_62693 [Plectosphaerella plurivora]|uniref:Secreted protein n=1 Tax=Plectosphaerella plurivora TaxID=936078 RepID=A0A9P9A6I8_9PEZI|nr:hypothetical protein F5X68DRAFT_62693 [Plectosphaerella plurivora]
MAAGRRYGLFFFLASAAVTVQAERGETFLRGGGAAGEGSMVARVGHPMMVVGGRTRAVVFFVELAYRESIPTTLGRKVAGLAGCRSVGRSVGLGVCVSRCLGRSRTGGEAVVVFRDPWSSFENRGGLPWAPVWPICLMTGPRATNTRRDPRARALRAGDPVQS